MSVNGEGSSARRVLAFLLEQRAPVTRPQVAAACDLSRPTVFTAVQRLEAAGVVEMTGQTSGSPGRSATLYEVGSKVGLLAAVDIGGSNVRVAVTDVRGQVLAERREPTARTGGSPISGQAVALVRSVLDSLPPPTGPLLKVVVSVPGVVGVDGATVHHASNIDQVEPFDFRTPFEEALLAPVVLDNNVNLAAVGEQRQGAAQDWRTFAVIAVGAGIGAGIVHDGRLLRGAHGAAGEVAYLPPLSAGRLREAGAHDEAGGLSLLRTARSRGGWAAPPPSTVQELFHRAAAGEEPAVGLVEEECVRVATVIASVCAVIDPGAVILTGGVGANDDLVSRTAELAAQMTPFPPSVIRSQLGDRASLVGAVHLATASAGADLLLAVED